MAMNRRKTGKNFRFLICWQSFWGRSDYMIQNTLYSSLVRCCCVLYLHRCFLLLIFSHEWKVWGDGGGILSCLVFSIREKLWYFSLAKRLLARFTICLEWTQVFPFTNTPSPDFFLCLCCCSWWRGCWIFISWFGLCRQNFICLAVFYASFLTIGINVRDTD